LLGDFGLIKDFFDKKILESEELFTEGEFGNLSFITKSAKQVKGWAFIFGKYSNRKRGGVELRISLRRSRAN